MTNKVRAKQSLVTLKIEEGSMGGQPYKVWTFPVESQHPHWTQAVDELWWSEGLSQYWLVGLCGFHLTVTKEEADLYITGQAMPSRRLMYQGESTFRGEEEMLR